MIQIVAKLDHCPLRVGRSPSLSATCPQMNFPSLVLPEGGDRLGTQRLTFHWKHGGMSSVNADMKPLREVENRRRADRPRYKPGETAPALPVARR
jgi:hypothetical protein